MSDKSFELYGRVYTTLGFRALAARLKRSGLRARRSDSSKIRIDEADFELERVGRGEYLVRAGANSDEEVLEAASRVSRVLIELDVRHSFEVYDKESELIHYLHHRWPQPETT